MGQTMLVVGALTMLAMLTLSINGTFISSIATGLEAQSQLNALSIAQTLLDEILARDFDETSIGTLVYADSQFTTSANFGPDGIGESLNLLSLGTILGYSNVDTSYLSKTRFDDVDDYHNYHRAVKDSILGWFYIKSTVSYARETYPDSLITDRTHYKVVNVDCYHPNLPVDLSDSTIWISLQDISIYRRYF
ncbi:MAG TPA: hypothetical protein VIL52_03815 [Bacteroidota bacterium]